MSFVFPLFLFALAALAIPIIVHLFNFRRYKKVYFTNVAFLKEVKEETASRSRLKHLMVLLSRLFALLFLVLAFVQPFIPVDENEVVKGEKANSIYIDNSFSMKAQSDGVSLLEKAKSKAREIVNAFQPEDRFQLITNDFEGKHQRLLDREEFLSYIDEVDFSPNVQSMDQVQSRQKQTLEKSDAAQKNIFLISDYQKSTATLENDTSYNYFLLPLQSAEQQNVFIDSIWYSAPVQLLNEANQMLVRLQNTGNIDVENSRLTLKVNDQTKAIVDVDIAARSSAVDTINFTLNESGWNRAVLSIADYPVDFDDDYYFSFYIDEKVKVLSINQSKQSPYLKAAFSSQELIELSNAPVGQLSYSSLSDHRLIVLHGLKDVSSGLAFELEQYIRAGGNVLVFPSNDLSKEGYNSFLKKLRVNTYGEFKQEEMEVDFINVKQEVFKDVFSRMPGNIDLPKAFKWHSMSRFSNAGEESLLRMRDGSSFLGKYTVGQGKLYLSAVALDNKSSNLPAHSIFVPMIYKIALLGGDVQSHEYTIGRDEFVEIQHEQKSAERILKMKGETEEFIPGQKMVGNKLLISLNNQLEEAGMYRLFESIEEPLAYLGFNFSRKESVLDYLKLDELKALMNGKNVKLLENSDLDLGAVVGQYDRGLELWKWCLILALVFLAIEILLLRLWKT